MVNRTGKARRSAATVVVVAAVAVAALIAGALSPAAAGPPSHGSTTAGSTTAGSTTAGSTTTGEAASRAAHRTWWAQHTEVYGGQAYRPRTLAISGDSTWYGNKMRWSVWNSRRAVGTGWSAINDCNPDCAMGTFHSGRARFYLYKPKNECGLFFFSAIKVVYVSGRVKKWDPYPLHVYCG